MNKLFLMAALMGAMTLPATAAFAEHHEGDYKGKKMEKVDTNGDGLVSKEEFLAKHEEMFNKMDADGNGSLTPEEMKEARGKMKERWKEMKEKREEMKENKAAE